MDKDEGQDIGILVKVNRKLMEITAQELADFMGLTASMIINLENGNTTLGWKHVPLLADALQLPVHVVAEANLRSKTDFREFSQLIRDFFDLGKTDKVINPLFGVKYKTNLGWNVAKFDSMEDSRNFATLCHMNGWEAEMYNV